MGKTNTTSPSAIAFSRLRILEAAMSLADNFPGERSGRGVPSPTQAHASPRGPDAAKNGRLR